MKLKARGHYAVKAMLDLALQGNEAPVSVQMIAKRQQIPAAFLEKLLIELRRAELVRSSRGAHGGYRLARSPQDIFLGQIFRAVGEPIEPLLPTLVQGDRPGDRAEDWVTISLWKCLGKQFSEVLDRVSLAELYYDARSWQAARGTTGSFII